MTVLLNATNVSKKFGAFEALKPMNFTLHPGEVRGLVGSNGAGKTTFIKVLTGAHAPTTGDVSINGKSLPANSTAAFLDSGIACIYQHSSLAPNLTVLENLYLGRHPVKFLHVIDWKKMRHDGLALIAQHDIEIDPDALVENIPTVKQKEVEILKVLALNAKVILMDEPTAWFSFSEISRLHQTIANLKAKGIAIVYISHMIEEIFQVCDSVSVLRDGNLVWNGVVSETNRPALTQKMLGEAVLGTTGVDGESGQMPHGVRTKKLAVKDLSRSGLFEDVSFDLYVGEILCITGLIGAKRTELVRCLFGADKPDSGTVELDGRQICLRSPKHAIDLGIGFVPEDRHKDGLFLSHSVSENLSMAALNRLVRGLILHENMIKEVAENQISDLNIISSNTDQLVGWLSGGNQQKVLIGKWLATKPSVLILDEPTVGIDIGAKSEIYGILNRLKDSGVAVLVISSDIEEVLGIADRIGVMTNGKLDHVFDATDISYETLVAKVSGGIA